MADNKTGFKYYNVDTDRYQDMKIKRLKKKFSCNGIAVYDYVLCEVYRVRGCFTEWDDNFIFDVADYFSIEEDLVVEIINFCCTVGLFDFIALKKYSVITSKSIQDRYIDMSKRAKRYCTEIPEKILIVSEEHDIIQEEPRILTEESAIVREGFNEVEAKKERRVFFVEIDDLEEHLKQDTSWCEVIAMQNQLDSVEMVFPVIHEFVEVLKSRAESGKSPKEAKSHFANWYKLEKQKIGKNGKTKRNLSTEICHANEHL